MGLRVADRPHRNWDGILRNWLVLREQGKYPPPPQHWTTFDNSPRCACCGKPLSKFERDATPRRSAPRCEEHAKAIAEVEEEFHVES